MKSVESASDLTGRQFGALIVIRKVTEFVGRDDVWECKCDCGKTCMIIEKMLLRGETKSCGCLSVARKALDITGQRFGKLIAIQPTKERVHRNVVWECKCDCGNTVYATAANLNIGKVKSCGCEDGRKRRQYQNLTGLKFGRLTAIRKVGIQGTNTIWECKCDCGNTTFASTGNLNRGRTKSCGCLRKRKAHSERD